MKLQFVIYKQTQSLGECTILLHNKWYNVIYFCDLPPVKMLVHTHACRHATHTHTHIHTHTHVCMNIHIHTHTHTCMHEHTHTTCIHRHTRMHTCVWFTFTNLQTQIFEGRMSTDVHLIHKFVLILNMCTHCTYMHAYPEGLGSSWSVS